MNGLHHLGFMVTNLDRTIDSDVNVVDEGPLAGWCWVYFRTPTASLWNR